MAGTEAGSVYINVKANTKPFNNSMHALSGPAEKLAAGIGRKIAAGLSAAAMVKFGKDCIDAGANLRAMKVMSDTAFPSMSKQAQNFAQNAAKNFGMAEASAYKYLGTYGSMAESMGLSEKAAYNLSTTLTGLAGDVASFYHISQDEAFGKLQAVFTGETESLRALGVNMTQTALDSYAMANGFGKATSAMSEAEKVALRYQFVVDKLKLAHGDFANYTNTWSGQMAVLRLQFESLKAAIGEGLINALYPAIKVINILIGKLAQLAEVFKTFTSRLFGTASGGAAKKLPYTLNTIGGAADSAAGGMDNLGSSSGNAGKAAKKAAKDLKKAQKDLMGFDKINKVASRQNSSADSGTSGSGGSIGGGGGGVNIDSLYGDADKASKALGRIKLPDKLVASFGRFKKAAAETFGLFRSAGKWVLDNVLAPLGRWTINDLAPAMLDVLTGALRVFNKVCIALVPIFAKVWDTVFRPLAKFSGKLIVGALELLAGALNKVADFAEKHPKMFQAITTGVLGLLAVKKLGGVGGILLKFVTLFGKFNALKWSWTKKLMSVGGVFRKVGGGALKAVKFIGPQGLIILGLSALVLGILYVYKNWNKIKKTKAGKAIIKVGKAVKSLTSLLIGKFKNAVKTVKDTIQKFKDTWDGIKTKAVELKAEAKEKIDGAIDKIKSGWESIQDKSAELIAEAKEKVAGAAEKLKSAWESVKDRAPELIAEAKEKVAGALKTISDGWTSIKEETKQLVVNTVETVKKTLTAAWDKTKSTFDTFVKVTGGTIKKTLSVVKGKANQWKKDALKTFNSIKNSTATKTLKLAGQTAVDKAKKVWDSFKTASAKISVTFHDAFTSAIKRAWNGIARGLNEAIGVINKIPGVNIGSVPYLASGGFVERNTPQLAVIGDNRHQGEVVAPEDKLQKMANQAARNAGSDNTEVVALLRAIITILQTMDPDVYMDGELITKTVVNRINRKTRSTGRSPLVL